jgi:hypothetical protein
LTAYFNNPFREMRNIVLIQHREILMNNSEAETRGIVGRNAHKNILLLAPLHHIQRGFEKFS